MVLVFSATGGLTGAEVGIAGGSAALAQKLLEALFSDDAVRRMSVAARELLATRVEAFFAEHVRTFTDLLAGLDIDRQAGERSARQHVAAVMGARDRMSEFAAEIREALPAAPEPPASTGAARCRMPVRPYARACVTGGALDHETAAIGR